MNKKAVVFTLISTVLLSVILLSFLIQSNNQVNVKIQKTNVEVETLNSFTKTLNDKYIPSVLRLSATQATKTIIRMIEDGSFGTGGGLGDPGYFNGELNTIYEDLMTDGYYGEEKKEIMFEDDVNYTLDFLFNEVELLSSLTGINFTYENLGSLNVEHKEPFTFSVYLDLKYNVSSLDYKTFFYYPNKQVSAEVPIYNFRDPLRIVENYEMGMNIMNISIKEAEHDVWDTTALEYDIDNITYISSTGAPSFLQRLKGDFTSSDYGIASFINTRYYSNPNTYTTVDHLYFTGNTDDDCRVTEIDYPNFYLRDEHRNLYGLGDCGGGGGEA